MDILYNLQDLMYEAGRSGLVVIVALVIFLVVIAVSGWVIYSVACSANRKTQLTGLVQVRVSLNEWPSGVRSTEGTRLELGEFTVSMKDPKAITADRIDPRITGMQKAYCRRYWVADLLQRFYENYRSAGLQKDPSCALLKELMGENNFLADLGRFYRKNKAKGLQIYRGQSWEQDKQDKNKVSVYAPIPEHIADTYRASTGCPVSMLCITMRYYSRNKNIAGG